MHGFGTFCGVQGMHVRPLAGPTCNSSVGVPCGVLSIDFVRWHKHSSLPGRVSKQLLQVGEPAAQGHRGRGVHMNMSARRASMGPLGASRTLRGTSCKFVYPGGLKCNLARFSWTWQQRALPRSAAGPSMRARPPAETQEGFWPPFTA